MFSPNVQSSVRQTMATNRYTSIQNICVELNNEAHRQKFFDESIEYIQKNANSFIEAFAYENGMQSNTIQPLMWSFSIEDNKLFDDGVVELIVDGDLCFSYMSVKNAKITLPLENSLVDNVGNIAAHEAWLNKLTEQISKWNNEIKDFNDKEKVELSVKLKTLESTLNAFKARAKNASKEAITEIEHQWNLFQEAINNIKDKIK